MSKSTSSGILTQHPIHSDPVQLQLMHADALRVSSHSARTSGEVLGCTDALPLTIVGANVPHCC